VAVARGDAGARREAAVFLFQEAAGRYEQRRHADHSQPLARQHG